MQSSPKKSQTRAQAGNEQESDRIASWEIRVFIERETPTSNQFYKICTVRGNNNNLKKLLQI